MEVVTMAHGAGGTVMQQLIRDYMLKHLGGSHAEVPLEALDDAAVIDDIVLKSDSYTVKPLFFPGGDIGSLAVCGAINDVCMVGGEHDAFWPRLLSRFPQRRPRVSPKLGESPSFR